MVIGIGGLSRAGKTSLAEKLADYYGRERVTILHQDDFVNPEDEIPKIHDRIDWEHPGSMNFKGLIQAIKNSDTGIVIVEGILVFFNSDLRSLFDKKILLEIDKPTFLDRRHQENRWGHEPEWFIQHVWDSYWKYGRPENLDEYILIKQNDELDFDNLEL